MPREGETAAAAAAARIATAPPRTSAALTMARQKQTKEGVGKWPPSTQGRRRNLSSLPLPTDGRGRISLEEETESIMSARQMPQKLCIKHEFIDEL